jgi:hypothetical protein
MSPDGIEAAPQVNVLIDDVLYPTGFVVALKWKNAGRSSAVRVHIYADHLLAPAGTPVPTFQLAEPIQERFGVVGPGLGASGNQKGISGDDFERVKRRELVWYVYSKVTYQTALDLSQVHHTETCGIVVYRGDLMDRPGSIPYPSVSLSMVGPQNTAT